MTIYIIGVIFAFILYRIGRHLEFKYASSSTNKLTETEYGELFGFYFAILCSWLGALLLAVIIGMMVIEINKGKKPPKWL